MSIRNSPEKADHELRVYSDIIGLIASPENPTPLVRINKLHANKKFQIYLKLERYNPFGSVKDRIALEMLSGLETQGRILIEPSSGNTGIALASLANALDLPVEIAVPERIPEEKKTMLKVLGATVHEADDSLCPLYPTEGARGLVNGMVKSPATRKKYISPNQYENSLNVLAHYKYTGPEIWKQTRGKIKFFFAGMGTCGTISGVGKYLKEQNPEIKIVAIEPASADHKLPGLKRITGLSDEFRPKILDEKVIDDIVSVSDEEAYKTAMKLARKEGILVGPTSGAAVSIALKYAECHRGLSVVIAPDDGFKYATFYRDFLKDEIPESKINELDLCDFVCPLSKIKAVELLDSLAPGETGRIVLGDKDSLKSVAQESKNRGLKLSFTQEEENRFVISVTK